MWNRIIGLDSFSKAFASDNNLFLISSGSSSYSSESKTDDLDPPTVQVSNIVGNSDGYVDANSLKNF